MTYFHSRKCYAIAKVSFFLVLVVTLLGLFEKWRGDKRAASAMVLSEQESEREILENEARIIPGLGERGAAAYLTEEDQELGESSEKKHALNVYLSDFERAYSRNLKAVQRGGGVATSERLAPPIVETVADTVEAFGYCAKRAEHYMMKRDGYSASYFDAAKEFIYCANIAHSVKTIAKGCYLVIACSTCIDDGESRFRTEDMGRQKGTPKTAQHLENPTLELETELYSPEVIYTKHRKFKSTLAVERRGAISLRAASALPPVVQTVADAAEAFVYCAARAEHYASEGDVMRTSVGAAMDFANCANIANTMKATMAKCYLSAAASSTTAGTTNLPTTIVTRTTVSPTTTMMTTAMMTTAMMTKAMMTTAMMTTTMMTTPMMTTPMMTTSITTKTTSMTLRKCCGGHGYEYSNVTDHCYKIHNESRVLWKDANRTCVAERAHLAVLSTYDEWDMLRGLIKRTNGHYFIGSYRDSNDEWKTVTGEKLLINEHSNLLYVFAIMSKKISAGFVTKDMKCFYICEQASISTVPTTHTTTAR